MQLGRLGESLSCFISGGETELTESILLRLLEDLTAELESTMFLGKVTATAYLHGVCIPALVSETHLSALSSEVFAVSRALVFCWGVTIARYSWPGVNLLCVSTKVELPPLPYEDWMDCVQTCAEECGFQSPILEFFRIYGLLQISLEPGCLEKLGSSNKLLETNDSQSALRLHFLSLLETNCLPTALRVHFISRACSINQMFPNLFSPTDMIVLAASLDKASQGNRGIDQYLKGHRLRLCGATEL